jgi:hypothetical protein
MATIVAVGGQRVNQRLVTVIPQFGTVIYMMQAVLTGPETNTKTQVKKHIMGACVYGCAHVRTHTHTHTQTLSFTKQ